MNHLIKYFVLSCAILLLQSCAKENLPLDETPTDAYKKLYSPQSGAFQERSKIFLNIGATDTILNNFSVGIGGDFKAATDIPLNFTVLGPEFVDAYNAKYNAKFVLLPEGSYSFAKDAVLKAGQNSTGLMPIKLHKNRLNNKTDYLLPLYLSSSNSDFPVDEQRRIIYVPFRTRTYFIGQKIGRIEQLSDPRADLFDFYGDLMLKDTSGNLWVYPLESNGNETIGEPKLVGRGYEGYDCFMFHPYYDKLFALQVDQPSFSFSSQEAGGPYSFTVTRYPDVKIGPPTELIMIPAIGANGKPSSAGSPQIITGGNGYGYGYANSDWGYIGYTVNKLRRFFAGVNGYTHFLHYQSATSSAHSRLGRLDGLGRFPNGSANNRGQSSWQPTQKSLCTLHDVQIVLNINYMQVYGAADPQWGSYPVYSYSSPIGSKEFYTKYVRMFSIYQKDLVFYEYDGDIVRYKDPDFESLWTPTNVD